MSPTTEYLAALPSAQRQALECLRGQVLTALPEAEEHFGYGLPGFKYLGHPLLYFGSTSQHCALYGSIPPGFAARLKGFSVSKGTIRFTPERPLPVAILKALVAAKKQEHDLRWGGRTP